jgi:hypothetical protein
MMYLLEEYLLRVGTLTEDEKHRASMAHGWLRRMLPDVIRNRRLNGRFETSGGDEWWRNS